MEFCSIGYLISATTRFLLLSNSKHSRHFVFSRARSRIQLIVGVNYRPRLPLETAQFTIMKVLRPPRFAPRHTHTLTICPIIFMIRNTATTTTKYFLSPQKKGRNANFHPSPSLAGILRCAQKYSGAERTNP